VVLHYKYMPPNVSEATLAKALCDRHFGVGADGLIIAKPGHSTEAPFEWSYINSDGSIGQMCGNGIRCFAKYVFDRGLTNETEFGVETLAGIITPKIQPDGQIKVNMGAPILEPSKIPVLLEGKAPLLDQPIEALDRKFAFTPVSMGNPHAIIFLSSESELEYFELEKYGSVVETHQFFLEKTNAEFAFVRAHNYIDLRVWERGCGVTLACGTGACATVVAANLKGLVNDGPVTVKLPGGELIIEWDKKQNIIYMTGPAESVFVGQLELAV
jgi:diaminopimelate epimerase